MHTELTLVTKLYQWLQKVFVVHMVLFKQRILLSIWLLFKEIIKWKLDP